MELKKIEKVNEKNYAKGNEVSKSELKKHTPNKWLVASAVGLTTLFYSNSNSILGHISVVFGCIPEPQMYEYSQFWHVLNGISNFSKSLPPLLFLLVIPFIVVCLLVDYIQLKLRKKIKKGDFEKINKPIINLLKIVLLILGFSLLTNILLDEWILDMDENVFYTNNINPDYLERQYAYLYNDSEYEATDINEMVFEDRTFLISNSNLLTILSIKDVYYETAVIEFHDLDSNDVITDTDEIKHIIQKGESDTKYKLNVFYLDNKIVSKIEIYTIPDD